MIFLQWFAVVLNNGLICFSAEYHTLKVPVYECVSVLQIFIFTVYTCFTYIQYFQADLLSAV